MRKQLFPTVLAALGIVAVLGTLLHTSTLDTPAPAATVTPLAEPDAEARAAVAVAYAWTATQPTPHETPMVDVDPFQTYQPEPIATPRLKSRCDCTSPTNCTCAAGTCECAACSWTLKAFERASRQAKPVAIWVGQKPTAVVGVLGYAADDYAATPIPGVMLARPENGDLIVVRRFAGTPTAAEIQAALQPRPAAPAPAYYPAFAPAFPALGGGYRGPTFGGGACRSGH